MDKGDSLNNIDDGSPFVGENCCVWTGIGNTARTVSGWARCLENYECTESFISLSVLAVGYSFEKTDNFTKVWWRHNYNHLVAVEITTSEEFAFKRLEEIGRRFITFHFSW